MLNFITTYDELDLYVTRQFCPTTNGFFVVERLSF